MSKNTLKDFEERAIYLTDNYRELGFGESWEVPDVKWDWEQTARKIASGEKPFGKLLPKNGKESLSIPEYEEELRKISKFLKSLPKSVPAGRPLEQWLFDDQVEPPYVLYGKRENFEAYRTAVSWIREGRYFYAQALYGLSFGYPELKIAAFLLRL